MLARGFTVTIVCSSDERMKSMKEFLTRENLLGKASVTKGILTAGMELWDRKDAIYGKAIYSAASRRTRKNAQNDKRDLK